MRTLGVVVLFTIFSRSVVGAEQPSPDYIWWEGEAAATTTFPKNNPFNPASLEGNANLLSNGNWLNATGKGGGQPVTAQWKLTVPADGEYALWARKFWKHGPFKWRFDSMPAGEWRECGPDVALADDTPLKKFVTASWVSLGGVKLAKGERTFDVELLTQPGKDWTACFDCFVLSRGPFVPNGKTKPGAKLGLADEGYFPFEPDTDSFRPDALLDLRSLNEQAAGQSGFLRRRGKEIVLGDGTPARFWAVNLSLSNAQQDRGSVDYLARKLAKLGVNMVRFHSPLWDERDYAKLDPKKLDALCYLIAAMKKQGIYTAISNYFPVWADGQKLGLEGFDGQQSKKPFALLYFDPRLQAMHRGWMQQMLSATNPYTGLTLARDPAVGQVEIINEDSMFFWTFGKQNIPAVHWQRLEDLYNQWLVRKYGQVAGAFVAWGGEKTRGDDGTARAALYEAFHMTANGVKQGGSGKARRVGDQVQFLAEQQKNFYDATVKFIKTDLQFGGLVSASNWTTADPMQLGAVERWTYTAGDVIDAHGYFEGEHKGDGATFSVRVGHTFKDLAAVKSPGLLPLRFQQVENYPQFISEIGFPQPNRYRADGTFLTSAYSSLQGVDGVFLFAVASNYVRDGAMTKFQVASPSIAQTFPAAALVYRQGMVKEPEPAVYRVTPVSDLWALKGVGGWSQDALDAFRAKDIPPGATVSGHVDKVDGYTPYVGPVIRSFGSDAAKSYQRELPKFIDRQGKVVASQTGELRWDYGNGVVVMNTPLAQGAAGFLQQAGVVAPANAKIALGNEFGTVTVVSLDGEPIAASRKVLVQVMTQEQPYGFKEQGGTITSVGSAPFGVRKIAGSVEVLFAAGGGTAKVVALDANGYGTNRVVNLLPGAGGVKIGLLPDVLYYVVSR